MKPYICEATQSTLPSFLENLLTTPPLAGEGVHTWLFKVARQLHAHRPAGEIVRLLGDRVRNCGRPVPLKEIQDAVRNALDCAWQPRRDAPQGRSRSKWPAVNHEQQGVIVRHQDGLAELIKDSPLSPGDREATEEIVDRLFPNNPLLCCGITATKENGESYQSFDTRPREEWRGQLQGLELIVPSPMSKLKGLTKEGKLSSHALDNTGPRRFLVCEFDKGTQDEQAAILIHLANYAPLVMVVYSGGKSLHGWFYAVGKPEEQVQRFFRYAVSLGADSATWTRSQFVRMPDATRGNGKVQRVRFLNYKALRGELQS